MRMYNFLWWYSFSLFCSWACVESKVQVAIKIRENSENEFKTFTKMENNLSSKFLFFCKMPLLVTCNGKTKKKEGKKGAEGMVILVVGGFGSGLVS